MAEFTPNFNLEKPDEDEFYNIAYFNENMDIIDKKLKEAGQSEQLQSDVTEIKNDIGSAEDLSTSPTIFGKLAEIKETLTTKFADIISKIAGIDSKIGTSSDSGTNTVLGKLENINTYLKNNVNSSFIGDNNNTYINNFCNKPNTLLSTCELAININPTFACCMDSEYLYIISSNNPLGAICRIKHDTLAIDYKQINTNIILSGEYNSFLVDLNYLYLVDNQGILYKIDKNTFEIDGSVSLKNIQYLGYPKGYMGQTSSYLVLRGAGNSSYQAFRVNKNTLTVESLSSIIGEGTQLGIMQVGFDNTYMYCAMPEGSTCTIYKVNISTKQKSSLYTFMFNNYLYIASVDSSNVYVQIGNIMYIISKTGELKDTFYSGEIVSNTINTFTGGNKTVYINASYYWAILKVIDMSLKTSKVAYISHASSSSSAYNFIKYACIDENIIGTCDYIYAIDGNITSNKVLQFRYKPTDKYFNLNGYKLKEV